MPSSRVMITASSVDPKPSITLHPKRRANSSMSRSLASLPNATRNVLSASSGCSGVAKHIGERLADVVQVRRAVPSHVGQEAARRELRRHHRRPAPDRHGPAGDDGVGVEERHREVADVVGRHREPLDQVEPGEQHHQVRHLHGLRLAAGAGGEDHHQRVHRLHLAVRRQLACTGEQGRPLGARRVEHAYAVEVEAIEERPVLGVGDQQLALRPSYVGDQTVAASRGVDAAQHVAAEPRSRHRPQHVGGVAEQRADVEGPLRVGQGDQRGRLGGGLGQVLAPGPGAVFPTHTDRVVVGPLAQQLLDGLRHQLNARFTWPSRSG